MIPNNDLFSTKREDWEWEYSIGQKYRPSWFRKDTQLIVEKCYNRLWSIISTWKKNNKIEGSISTTGKVKSLGKLNYVGGSLDLGYTKIKCLDNLKYVGGSLFLYHTPIESLGKLEYVGGSLNLVYTKIKTLGNLKHVGKDLDIYNLNVKSLENLEYIGGDLIFKKSQMPIIKDGVVKGKIVIL